MEVEADPAIYRQYMYAVADWVPTPDRMLLVTVLLYTLAVPPDREVV
jgi:hypothetical protein